MNAVSVTQAPAITVVRGRPAPAELAAVVAVLLAAGAAAAAVPAAPSRFSAWSERSRSQRGLPRPGPHSWRASGLPR
jgi:acyl-CoA carboxylase epsilon subunit